MNTALPIRPLARVTSPGDHPLKNSLHLGLLLFLWFLPVTLFLLAISGGLGFGVPRDWAHRLQFTFWPWLGIFAAVVAVLSALVGRSASTARTLAVHALGIALVCVSAQWWH